MTDPDGMRNFGIRPFSSGMFACPCKALCPRTVRGSPMNVLTSGVPKPSLKPQSTQTIRTRPKVVNTIITVLIAHFFWTRPPYRTARAGMDISPTSVAAVICQALSPALSQLGYGFTMPPWANRPAGSNVLAGSTLAAPYSCKAYVPCAGFEGISRLLHALKRARRTLLRDVADDRRAWKDK